MTEHVFHSEGVRFSCRSEATEGCRLAEQSEQDKQGGAPQWARHSPSVIGLGC